MLKEAELLKEKKLLQEKEEKESVLLKEVVKEGVKEAEKEKLEEVLDDEDCIDISKMKTIVVDGHSYLYDEDGDYAGIEKLLLTEEGTPVGIYDEETKKVTVVEFEEE
tara:strand:+ start:233 stop:556 length:324 start_codon:yes stop_codon:yes gene_type:complete